MIIKNKALSIFDFVSPPDARLYERAARFHLKSIAEVLDGKSTTAIAPGAVFGQFPEIAAALAPRVLQNSTLLSAVKADPMAALRVLLTNYGAFTEALEPTVLSSGEALYYLLKASREQKFALRDSFENYLAYLMKDPFWALRTWGDTQDEKILAQCMQLAKTQKDKHPGAAYLHLYFTPDADTMDFVEILSTAPMYAYLSSRHFYERNIEFKYFGLRGLTPRWAYHFITDGFLDDEEGLIETMMGAPDWLTEYIVESERYKDLAYTGGVVDKLTQKNPASPLIPHLKQWWERTQDYVKKLPPPKPLKIPGANKTEEKKA
jgi:hypothetical protein